MDRFDMLDPIACDLEARRKSGEAEEAKHYLKYLVNGDLAEGEE